MPALPTSRLPPSCPLSDSTHAKATHWRYRLHAGQWVRYVLVGVLCMALTGCGIVRIALSPLEWLGGSGVKQSGGVRGSKPYTIKGVTYYPLKSAAGFREEGIASWYGKPFHGRLTANGERYNMYAMTAAHTILPFNTTVRVTNIRTGRSVHVRVNDRGPFIRGRVIDLSYTAAQRLGIVGAGTARVRVNVIDTR